MFKRFIDYFYKQNTEIEQIKPTTLLDEKQVRQRARSFDEKYKTACYCDGRDIECAICLSFVKIGSKYKSLRCSHVYHEECIKNWVVYKNKQTCPMCNSMILGMNEMIVKG